MRQANSIILFFIVFNLYGQIAPSPDFFQIKRESPLLELNTTITVSVSDYNAIVNDGKDDIIGITNAINEAVKLASSNKPVRLLFDKGTYDLMPDGILSHAIEVKDANNIVWDGQEAEFLVHNPSVGFLSLLRCKNMIIKNLSVDYATLPYTQGIITKVDNSNSYFDFIVDEGFPLPTEAPFTNAPERWGMIKNANGSLKKGTPNLIPHRRFFELIDTRTYRYGNQHGNLDNVAVGDYFVHIARNNGKTIIRNNGGKNLTYLNVTAFSSPAGGFNAFNSEEWHIINSKVKLKSGRVHSLNADCIHVNGGKIGPWVENCVFEGFADDCVNLKYTKRTIKEIHSPTQITVEGNVFNDENIEFFNPREGIIIGNAKAIKVENLGSNLFKVELSNPVNITYIKDPDHQSTDKAYIESRSNQSFIFRNNIVRNSRRYGILLQNKYALIENNLFQNLSSSGITIQNGVDWGEGFRVSNIVINNNTLINCGFDASYNNDNSSAGIKIDFMKLGKPCGTSVTWCGTETSDFKGHSNIKITNNHILYNKKGVYLKNVEGLVFHNNFLCHSGQDISLRITEQPISQTILNSTNVSIVDFKYSLPNPYLHFVMNETRPNFAEINKGQQSDIQLKINVQNGGQIIKGKLDEEVGYTYAINTEGNGNITLISSTTNQSFTGAISNEPRTYSFWIKPEKRIFQTLLYSGGPDNGSVFAIQMLDNGIVRVTDNNQNFVSMSDMPLDFGKWNHIVVSVPSGASMFDISLYKNGISSIETYSGYNNTINTTARPILFFPRFNGLVSDIRYFDYDLCNGEVELIFKNRLISKLTQTIDKSIDNLSVYPNITNDFIYFNEPISSLKIIDLHGRLLLSKSKLTHLEWDLSSFKPNMYIIKINESKSFKILKI